MLVGLVILSTLLQGQRPPRPQPMVLPLRRIAAVPVEGLPEAGYFLIDSPDAWRHFLQVYHPDAVPTLPTRLNFNHRVILGVLATASGCKPGPFVHALERRADTAQVVVRWLPNQWGPCQMQLHAADLIWLPSPVGPLEFVDEARDGARSKISLARVDLR